MPTIDITAAPYNAVGDAEWAQTTLSITVGTAVLTSGTAIWAVGDVGKSIVVGQIGGPGALEPNGQQGGNPLRTTIAGYTSATQITLGANAVSGLSSAPDIIVAWGTNNETAFQDFQDDYQGVSSVILTIPAGAYLISSGNIPLWDGITGITVNATGATICGGTFSIACHAQSQFAGHSGHTASASAGATSVDLLTPADVSKFAVGDYALMTGFGMQIGGFPSNHQRFEYLLITAINSDTMSPTYGRITFSTPLVNSYLSTWPLFVPENIGANTFTGGGPATLYAMDTRFNRTIVVNGLTIAHHAQWKLSGKSSTLNDCVVAGLFGTYVSEAVSATMNDCLGVDSTMEVDKQVTTFTMNDCSWGGLAVQSSSVGTMILDNTDVEFTLVGAAQETIIRNGSALGTLNPSLAYGFANSLTVSDSVISNFGAPTTHESGHVVYGTAPGDVGVNVDFTMDDGMITIPESAPLEGYVSQWAITGYKMFFSDANVGTLGSFTITNVTQDEDSTYVHTDYPRANWPSRSYGSTGLRLVGHPAPVCTFTSVTGCPEVVDLSFAPAGAPLYSYSKRIITAYAQTGFYWQVWGRIKYIRVTVTSPYVNAGVPGAVQATLSHGNGTAIKMSDFSNAGAWSPVIDLKVTGVRTFDATANDYSSPVTWASTAVAAADTLPSQTEALWCAGNYRVTMPDITAFPSSPAFEFTVEFITDQGFTSGRTFTCTFS